MKNDPAAADTARAGSPSSPSQQAPAGGLALGTLQAVLLPAALLVGAALGEAAALALGVPQRGAGAACGALAVLVTVPLGILLGWRHGRRSVVVPPVVDASATRDELTGAFTQRHFVAAADREWSRIRRHGEDAALLMVDLDRFREINDKVGQTAGDAVLVEITRQVSAMLRQYDLLARFGGGVLVLYLPHTDPIGALDVAERIRERVASLRISCNGQPVTTTVSIGAAAIGPDHAALDAVIADAGTALREAKAAGRNCVRAAPVQPRRNPTSGSPLGGHRAAGKA
ncbi:MAG: GGDEF domain-containing protein [Burkholderiales bacterium]|nr:GGDEF domain-containing protein [Burkholderiales bacterium]